MERARDGCGTGPHAADRIILHSDMNCFYANVECQQHPGLRGKPVAVGGSERDRHGIVLAKNQIAKRWGVQTAEPLRQARRKCPHLVVVPPDYRLYLEVSQMARRIYYDYTDLVEPFGPDEAWIDISGSYRLWAPDPQTAARIVAREISERVKAELGLTVSIGVSWNKIFAKFGSDCRKPDAITFVSRQNYRTLVWQAPVRSLLYVGPATQAKLHSCAIDSIGQLACASDRLLERRLGKTGLVLKSFALGRDDTPVRPFDAAAGDVPRPVESYGNGLTSPFDIVCEQDAKCLVRILVESVAQRLREGRAKARTLCVSLRDANGLTWRSRQAPLRPPSNVTSEIMQAAWQLARSMRRFGPESPVRGIAVRASGLSPESADGQLSLFDAAPRRARELSLDRTVDGLRRRFGNGCIARGTVPADSRLLEVHVRTSSIVHPESFFR